MPKTIFMNKSTDDKPASTPTNVRPSPQPGQKPGMKISPPKSPQPSPQPKLSPQPKSPVKPKAVPAPIEIKKEEPAQEPPKELKAGRKNINMQTYIDTPDDDWGVMAPVHKAVGNALPKVTNPVLTVPVNPPKGESIDKPLYVLDQDGLNTLISSLVNELSERFVTKEEVQTLVRNSLQTMVMEQVRPKK